MNKHSNKTVILFLILIFVFGSLPVLAEDDLPVLTSVTPDRDNGLLLQWEPGSGASADPSGIKYYILRSENGTSFQAVASRDPSYGLFFLMLPDSFLTGNIFTK